MTSYSCSPVRFSRGTRTTKMMNVARTENTRKGTSSAGWPIPFLTEETITTMTNSLTSSTSNDFAEPVERVIRRSFHLVGQGATRKARRMKPQARSSKAKPKAQTHCVHTSSYQPYHHSREEQTELHSKMKQKSCYCPSWACPAPRALCAS